MLKIFGKKSGEKKSEEPSLNSAHSSYHSICSTDRKLMYRQLEDSLARHLAPISYKVLFEDALGFINKKDKKLYFEAAYMNLHDMIFNGLVERISTPLGDEYAFTNQGLAAYNRSAKKRDMNIRRKENVEQEFSAFMDSAN